MLVEVKSRQQQSLTNLQRAARNYLTQRGIRFEVWWPGKRLQIGLLMALLGGAMAVQAAGTYPPCVRKRKAGYSEPATLKALLACQERKRAHVTLTAKVPRGPEEVEGLGDFQRTEVRDYLSRHPERASTGNEEEGVATDAAYGRVAGVEAASASGTGKPGTELSRAALLENEQKLPAELREGYRDLHDLLWKKSDDGRQGITKDMVQDILGYLQKTQGGVSVEMSELLKAVGKDGPKLTDETMGMLKKASRDVKGEGLELGIKPDVEKDLLNPQTDPPGRPPGPSVN